VITSGEREVYVIGGFKNWKRDQPLEGIKNSMSHDYMWMARECKDLLFDAKLFCKKLVRWIDLEWWKKFYVEGFGWQQNETFADFLNADGWNGLGFSRTGTRREDLELLAKAGIPGAQRIWSYYLEADAKVGAGLKGHGGDRKSGKFQGCDVKPKVGRGSEYLLSRLLRDASDDSPQSQKYKSLLAEVRAGNKSLHAAAIEAGYRKLPSPEEKCLQEFLKCQNRVSVIQELVDKLTREEREKLEERFQERKSFKVVTSALAV
jgi:hypothetical protein